MNNVHCWISCQLFTIAFLIQLIEGLQCSLIQLLIQFDDIQLKYITFTIQQLPQISLSPLQIPMNEFLNISTSCTEYIYLEPSL